MGLRRREQNPWKGSLLAVAITLTYIHHEILQDVDAYAIGPGCTMAT